MKKILAFSLTTLAFIVHSQEIRDWKPDEGQIRCAMREEILRRIEKRARGVDDPHIFDFQTNQAFEKIRARIRTWSGKEGELYPFLSALYASSDPAEDLKKFRELVDGFAYGWGIELRDTLQAESDEIYFFLLDLRKFNRDLESRQALGRAACERLLSEYGLPRSLPERVAAPDLQAPHVAPRASTFAELAALKRLISGSRPDQNQRIMFALGDRYRERYTFVQDFLARMRYLLGEYTSIAAEARGQLKRLRII